MQNLSNSIENRLNKNETELTELTKLNELHKINTILMAEIETKLKQIYEINPNFETTTCMVSNFGNNTSINSENFDKICSWITTVEPKKQYATYEYYVDESLSIFYDGLTCELEKLIDSYSDCENFSNAELHAMNGYA